MIKFILGVLLIFIAIWTPFYLWTFVPNGWVDAWYAFPLFISTAGTAFLTFCMGIGCVATAIYDA